jgi:hypothetical protein
LVFFGTWIICCSQVLHFPTDSLHP